ncbi:MAG: very short patch repair endonuclease [Halobacteriovoraceae bacterium]|nr:very short patch repair endonuclease [Halobacteriovoraceae bacterium]
MDTVSPEKRSEIMSKIKATDSKVEIAVRKYLFAKGYRYRKNASDLPGRPDILMPKHKTAIFIHGCFWHGHKNCKYHRIPKTRTEYWKKKIEGNSFRDIRNANKLRKMGWRCFTVWECRLKNDFLREMEKLEKKIMSIS